MYVNQHNIYDAARWYNWWNNKEQKLLNYASFTPAAARTHFGPPSQVGAHVHPHIRKEPIWKCLSTLQSNLSPSKTPAGLNKSKKLFKTFLSPRLSASTAAIVLARKVKVRARVLSVIGNQVICFARRRQSLQLSAYLCCNMRLRWLSNYSLYVTCLHCPRATLSSVINRLSAGWIDAGRETDVMEWRLRLWLGAYVK